MVYTKNDLTSLKKDQLIDIILEQQKTRSELNDLNIKLGSLEKKIDEIQSISLVRENASNLLFCKVKELEKALLKSEQYSRRECLDITGLGDDSDEDLETNVCTLFSNIGVALDKDKDVQACHRYGKKKTVIIKFTNRKHVHKILSLKSELPKEIFVNETLCPRNKLIRGRCGLLKKEGQLANVATRNGMVRVKKVGGNGYINIEHEHDIQDMFPNFKFPF